MKAGLKQEYKKITASNFAKRYFLMEPL